MTHNFSELEEKMSPESRACVDQVVQEALKELLEPAQTAVLPIALFS
jgi:Na+/H+-translocating membrane pyrophosphatase